MFLERIDQILRSTAIITRNSWRIWLVKCHVLSKISCLFWFW